MTPDHTQSDVYQRNSHECKKNLLMASHKANPRHRNHAMFNYSEVDGLLSGKNISRINKRGGDGAFGGENGCAGDYGLYRSGKHALSRDCSMTLFTTGHRNGIVAGDRENETMLP